MKTRLLSLTTCLIAYIAMAQVDVRTQNISVDLDATGNASISAQDIDNGSVSVTGMDYVNGPEINIVGSSGGEIAFSVGFLSSSSSGVPLSINPSPSSFQTSSSFDGIKVRAGDYVYLRCTLNNGSRPSGELVGFRTSDGRMTWGGSTSGTFANRSQYLIEQDGKTEGDLIDFSLPFSMRLLANTRYLGQSGSIFDDFATPQPLTIDLVSGDPGFEDATSGLSLSLDQTTFDCSDLSVNQNDHVVDLTASNDYISAGDESAYDMTTALSFAAWVKPNGRSTESILFNREGEYELAISSNGNLAYAIANSNPGWTWVDTPVHIPLNEWVHIAFTYDSGGPKIYINGKLVYVGSGIGTIGDVAPSQNELRFGWRENLGPNNKFSGFMDEISLWNRVLTPQQIENLLTIPLDGTESGLVLHYRISSGESNTLSDSTSNSFDGNIIKVLRYIL